VTLMEQRATVFGFDAERYDRARPGYPAEMIDRLVCRRAMSVLDVGCGTGIASRAFAQRGCAVLGVEPDARMAAVASDDGIEVEVARFEDWDSDRRTFDVVVSAQAWHWVDPIVGPTIARNVLSEGGRLRFSGAFPTTTPRSKQRSTTSTTASGFPTGLAAPHQACSRRVRTDLSRASVLRAATRLLRW